MNIHFKIVEVHPQQHSIVVRYYTDVITEQMLASQVDPVTGVILRARTDYNIDLPVPHPVGDALNTFILGRAPVDWLKLQEDVLNPAIDTSMVMVKELLGVEKVMTVDPAAKSVPYAGIVTTPDNIQTV
jgi:hypothetical protein